MPKFSKSFAVDVHVRKSGAKFTIDDIDPLVFNKHEDDLYRTGHYNVTFKVNNHDGAAYYFASEDEGFWVQVDDKSGPPKHQQLHYCKARDLSKDKLELTVRNDDPRREDLKYTLNLISDVAGQGPLQLDPIMSNQNGGVGFLEQRSLGLLGGILAAAAIVAGVALVAKLVRDEEDD